MLIKEYRILLPVAVEEYHRGQMFAVAKVSKAETKDGEGVEVLINEPREHPVYGRGQYTKKLYHIGSRMPAFLRKIMPASAMVLEEEAWNCFPYCKTIIQSGMFKDKMTFTIETMHSDDAGNQDNALKLTDAQLKKRKVDWIKISEDKVDKKQYKKELDPALYKCDVSSPARGPFTAGWETRSPSPLMCAYKVVTYEFKYRLVGGMVEKFMEKFERDLFLRFHRELVCTMHEWMNLSMEDIRKIEDETAAKLREEIHKAGVDPTSAEAAAASSSELNVTDETAAELEAEVDERSEASNS